MAYNSVSADLQSVTINQIKSFGKLLVRKAMSNCNCTMIYDFIKIGEKVHQNHL